MGRRIWAALAVAACVALASAAGGQPPGGQPKGELGLPHPPRFGQGLPGGAAPPKSIRKDAGAGFTPQAPAAPKWPFKVKFRIGGQDLAALSATYYPARGGPNSPVALLVHDRAATGRVFESGIDELKGKTLAETLQRQGFAVLLVDLRNRGASRGTLRPIDLLLSPTEAEKIEADKAKKVQADQKTAKKAQADEDEAKKAEPKSALAEAAAQAKADAKKAESNPPRREFQAMITDLQAAYAFLLDRHNRGEFNIGKLAVIGTGDGSNLAVTWAVTPGGATASPGRSPDLAALVLVSPLESVEGVAAANLFRALGRRAPVLLLAGALDAPAAKVAEANKEMILDHRHGRVEVMDKSPLKGADLIRFEPGTTAMILQFLDTTAKLRPDEWEPRYNLAPVAITRGEVSVVGDPKKAEADAKAEPEPEPAEEPPVKKADGKSDPD